MDFSPFKEISAFDFILKLLLRDEMIVNPLNLTFSDRTSGVGDAEFKFREFLPEQFAGRGFSGS
jgi:hypothetical protein